MRLVLTATNRRSEIKSLEYKILGKLRKHVFFYETIKKTSKQGK